MILISKFLFIVFAFTLAFTTEVKGGQPPGLLIFEDSGDLMANARERHRPRSFHQDG
jgi:hypothetical protein